MALSNSKSKQTAPSPKIPKTDRGMFIKKVSPVPGDDPGKPKHKIGQS